MNSADNLILQPTQSNCFSPEAVRSERLSGPWLELSADLSSRPGHQGPRAAVTTSTATCNPRLPRPRFSWRITAELGGSSVTPKAATCHKSRLPWPQPHAVRPEDATRPVPTPSSGAPPGATFAFALAIFLLSLLWVFCCLSLVDTFTFNYRCDLSSGGFWLRHHHHPPDAGPEMQDIFASALVNQSSVCASKPPKFGSTPRAGRHHLSP